MRERYTNKNRTEDKKYHDVIREARINRLEILKRDEERIEWLERKSREVTNDLGR